jgi:ATP-dependent Clp protease adaptor protein ClpS
VSQVADHLERKATAGDLWARVSRYPAVMKAFEAGGLPAHRLLFALVHGGDAPAPRLQAPVPPTVHVVLRNDDVTTFEFVRDLLREVFELDDAAAQQISMTTHHEGRAIVGRYPPDVAASRIESARSRAREAGFPLWVGVEPA